MNRRAADFRNASSVSNRNALLGTSSQGSGDNGGDARSRESDAMMMEQQNDDHLVHLSQKISLLKQVTLDIGDEVRGQNAYLQNMDTDFHRTSGLLGSTSVKLNALMNSPHGRQMCYLVMFVVGVFFFLFLYMRWKA